MKKLNDNYQIITFKGIIYLIPFKYMSTILELIDRDDMDSLECLLLIADGVMCSKDYNFIMYRGEIFYE